jgi:predicted acylesterase/phospholipase RssA
MEKKSDQVERFSFLKLFKTNIPYFSHIFSHSGSFPPSGLFSGKKVKSYWKKNFEKNNRPDNFMYLKKELYIAATDINTGERVVFGKNENQDAQISSAIQASSAVPFFFESVNIGGRDLVDGIVSGNLPVEVACEHGASLIIGINPFGCFNPKNSAQKIPEMGMIKLLEQSLRLAVKRDIENSAELMRIKYPEVDMIILQPDENNPTAFKYNPLNSGSMKEIMEYAYEETRQRILADYKNMRSILQKHKFILK